MNGLLRLIIRDFKVMNRSLLAVQFLLPFFLLFVASFAYRTLIPALTFGNASISYQQFLAAGLVAQTTMTGSLLSGTLLWTDRRHGMFEQILVGPFSRLDYVLGKVISSALVGLLGGAIVFLVSSFFFLGAIRITLVGSLLGFASLVLGAVFFGSIALLIASNVKSLEAFEGIFNLLLILLTFVSSVLYPATVSPQPIQLMMLINPLTYMSDILRSSLYGITSANIPLEAAALAIGGLCALVIALCSLRRMIAKL